MDYTKELLLFVASTFVGAGTAQMTNGSWQVGTLLLLIGSAIFVGRGFYKKYIG